MRGTTRKPPSLTQLPASGIGDVYRSGKVSMSSLPFSMYAPMHRRHDMGQNCTRNEPVLPVSGNLLPKPSADLDGVTALAHAKARGFDAIVTLIRAHGG